MRIRIAPGSLLTVAALVAACGGSEDASDPAPSASAGSAGQPAGSAGAAGVAGKSSAGAAGIPAAGAGGTAGTNPGGQAGQGGSTAGASGGPFAGAAGKAGASGGGAGASGASGSGGAAAGAAGSSGGAGGSAGAGTGLLPAAAVCAPKGKACDAKAAAGDGPRGTYRKDIYLPAYNETSSEPTTGGRFHVVAPAGAGGDVTKIVIDGVDVASLGTPNPSSTPPFEWANAWPRKGLKAGDAMWINFHSKAAKWDTATGVQVTVETTGGKAVDQVVPIAQAKVAVTYVATTDDLSTVIVHLKNTDGAPHTLARVIVDGLDATLADTACVPKTTLSPGESMLVSVPTCQPSALGAARTVVVELTDGPATVAGLRVAKTTFPIESWNNSDNCAFPGSNKPDTFAAYLKAGIDTSYFSADNCSICGCDPFDVLAVQYPKTAGAFTLATESMLGLAKISDTSKILAVSTGDESDGEVYETKDPNKGAPRPFFKAKESLDVWEKYPELLTFNGGKTNENVGAFAGSSDIQGMDLYSAACAPYILPFPGFPSAKAPFDYLKNARNNHMPLPTWLYSQGLSPAWGEKQPDPQEIIQQGFSAIVAGAKGLMWFQANQSEAQKRPDRFAAMTRVNRMVRGVRPYLREGDLTGLATGTPDVVVDAIRSRAAIVVPVVNMKTTAGPDWTSCGLASVSPALLKHWIFASVSPSISVSVPADFAVEDVFEVGDGVVSDVVTNSSGRDVSLGPVALSNAVPVRLFVLASSKDVRAAVKSAMSF